MNVLFFDEPQLQFGNGLHLDNKFGLMSQDPFDISEARRPEKILIGIVGSPQTVSGILRWFKRIELGISAKASKKPNLFPHFPGIEEGMPFKCQFQFDKALQTEIVVREYVSVCKDKTGIARLDALADILVSSAKYLQEKGAQIVIIALPSEIFPMLEEPDVPDSIIEGEGNGAPEYSAQREEKIHFHDLLKARSMEFGVVIQVVRPSTYDDTQKRETDAYGKSRNLQDEATRAWNLVTALYYKAGGIPWRIPRNDYDLDTCYLGISFYKSLDSNSLQTSVAQVFNERGYGLIVKGGMALFNKEDRQVHLSRESMRDLVEKALTAYRREHHHPPARLMVHKSSQFSMDEINGASEAIQKAGIYFSDLISLRESFIRLYRNGYYPPLRGTCLELSKHDSILYTRGTVYFYEEYPGMYVPRSLRIRFDEITSSKEDIYRGLLLLSKMNWNNTQMAELWPITLRASKQVGSILKHVHKNSRIESHYKFYM